MNTSVLVTDGDQRAALAITRSLGKAGCDVGVAAPRVPSLAGSSRYCAREAAVPDPLDDSAGFVSAISELIARWGSRVVLPVTEASLRALLAARQSLGDVVLPFPPLDTFAAVSDKARLLQAAAELGIAVPRQAVLMQPGATAGLGAGLRFPLVLKPHASVTATDHGAAIKLGVRYAATSAELETVVATMPKEAFPLLLQERVVGPGLGVFLLRWNGQRLAVFCHRRIREKPPSGGISVCAESVAVDRALVSAAERLLERFDWEGVAMVEFKLDTATGTPYLMEVNGRFWGSLELAIRAGVDFPRLLVSAALGQPDAFNPPFPPGLRVHWWWGEVDHLLARFRRSDAELALPPGAESRWSALRGVVRDMLSPATHNEICRRDDLRPAVRETIDWFTAL